MTTKFVNNNEPQTTINYLRSDKLFRGKNIEGTNLRNLLIGLAVEVYRAENKLEEVADQYDPTASTKLIGQWEQALGIPNDCIPKEKSIDDRRNWILIKLASLGVSTKEQFEFLGDILGYSLTVTPGEGVLSFPYTFPIILSDVNPRFAMVVEAPAAIADFVFPYTFPFVFGEDKTAILKCLFQKLAPSNVKVFFNFI